MSKIMAVAASARRNGNSDLLLQHALAGIRSVEPDAEVETMIPFDLSISPCRSCRGCHTTGRCVVQDGMQEIYPKLDACDHMVVATPVYFTTVPGHLKLLIDRSQCYWARRALLHEPPAHRRTGMCLCVGALDREKYYQATLTVVKTWMMELGMKCTVTRFYPGLDGPDAALGRSDYLEDATQAGRDFMSLQRQ